MFQSGFGWGWISGYIIDQALRAKNSDLKAPFWWLYHYPPIPSYQIIHANDCCSLMTAEKFTNDFKTLSERVKFYLIAKWAIQGHSCLKNWVIHWHGSKLSRILRAGEGTKHISGHYCTTCPNACPRKHPGAQRFPSQFLAKDDTWDPATWWWGVIFKSVLLALYDYLRSSAWLGSIMSSVTELRSGLSLSPWRASSVKRLWHQFIFNTGKAVQILPLRDMA